MNIGVRRWLMALVAAIGVAITMVVTNPFAPANATIVDHKAPAVPAGTQTTTLHAKARGATSGEISPRSHPLDISCQLDALAPVAGGGRTDSIVTAVAQIRCRFDIDGSPAKLGITLTSILMYRGEVVKRQTSSEPSVSFDAVTSAFSPCNNGPWGSVAEVKIVWPEGYEDAPPSAQTDVNEQFFDFGDCPNDYVEVPTVIDTSFVIAKRLLQEAELVGVVVRHDLSCDFNKDAIMDQRPSAGQLALRGSTVELTQSDGPPRTRPCR